VSGAAGRRRFRVERLAFGVGAQPSWASPLLFGSARSSRPPAPRSLLSRRPAVAARLGAAPALPPPPLTTARPAPTPHGAARPRPPRRGPPPPLPAPLTTSAQVTSTLTESGTTPGWDFRKDV
jgi:hypothetical protein